MSARNRFAVVRLSTLVAMLSCSGKARTPEDANRPSVRVDGAAPAPADAPPAAGEAAIRVEWKAVPTAARVSPGRTPCNTPRAAAVAPTTLWGIPDGIVIVDAAPPPAQVRIQLADCALSPRVAIARSLIVESSLDRPAKISLIKHGDAAKLDVLQAGPARTFQLPIAGHAVSIALDDGGVYQLAIEGAGDNESAWIVSAPGTITDVTGLATLKLPAGSHTVTAWLPSRGGGASKLAKSTVTVEANQLAELTIDLNSL